LLFSHFSSPDQQEVSKNVPKVISYLIDHCPDLFGESVLTLLGPELEPVRPDSGAEVSDSSCNSLQEHSSSSSAGGAKKCNLNDMTSGGESDRKNKTSLSNLSRDSGLTASDTQLYSPDRDQDQDHDSVPEEEKMVFSLPASASPPITAAATTASLTSGSPANAFCYERKKSGSPSSGSSSISMSRKKNKLLNNNNHHNHNNNNNNSSKCVNRVLSSSIPHLNTDELESMLNGTFSYGKSIGIGINGSCQDVVRNRKRHQVFQSTPVPLQQLNHQPGYHFDDDAHPLIHQTPTSHRNLKCRSSIENCPPCPSLSTMNLSHNSYHNHHHNQQQHQLPHHNHHNHLNNCVNRFFSKSVPHLNLIGFRNSVTFSPTPRRATRVNLHGWSYDVSDAQRHNQSLPNDHYQPLGQEPADSNKLMFRCRATPFISYGSQQTSTPSTTGYTRPAAGSAGPITGHSSITVNGKRLHSMSCLPSQCSYSPYGSICPPSYQETMDRKKFVARLQSNVSLFRKISFDGVYEQFELRL
jgi:hypothetical protein